MTAWPRTVVRRQTEELRKKLSPLDARLRGPTVEALAERILAETGGDRCSDRTLVAALSRSVDAALADVHRLERESSALLAAYQGALNAAERREILLRHLQGSSTGAELRRDAAATRRWLDLEAVQERLAMRIADRVDTIHVGYEIMRTTAACDPADPTLVGAWKEAGVLAAALVHAGSAQRAPVRVAALRFLAAAMGNAALDERLAFLGVAAIRKLLAWARGVDATRWVRIAALDVAAVVLPVRDGLALLEEQVKHREGDDSMVIRRNALRILQARLPRRALRTALRFRRDPSEHVRQELARVLASQDGARSLRALCALVSRDASVRVAGLALRELSRRARRDPEARGLARDTIAAALVRIDMPTLVRAALEAARDLAGEAPAVVPVRGFLPALEALANHADAPPDLVMAAAATLRHLEAESSPTVAELRETLAQAIRSLREGEHRVVKLAERSSSREVELALSAASHGDMTTSLRPLGRGRFVLTRGEPRGWRAWRALQELRTPMPDKRKGFVHSHGRLVAGTIVAPPVGMAEVTPTRVPGERQLCPAVGGWGPFLPRVDDLLAVSTLRPRKLRLVTALGTVTIEGPRALSGRLRAALHLTLRYARFADERERSLAATEPRERRQFAESAKALGFTIVVGDQEGIADGVRFRIRPSLVARYHAAAGLLPLWLEPFQTYLVSYAGNSTWQLALLAWVIFAGFVARAALIMRGIERSRQAVPLRIGGWGTRGKSGTERLKAALFHALRYDVVVKTTGCEAMFIHAQRDLPAQEVFIYRPYDKATIWEQRKLLEVAERLHAQVFLWECMALQPRYVDTLAAEWMQDEVTTLTNAYPDHEDIQGPSGEDVARVIARFMPTRGLTLTSEDQMLPLLADRAAQKGTRLVSVSPLEAELLPTDLLARLPYQEHPRNVALVLAMADHFGIDREFALVEIADHVVLDLGVLKTYPTVEYRRRQLTFSNGMSANERAGFMSNWNRLGFDKFDVDTQPKISAVAVVNNRADRVARSRVFAQIFVDDAAVDHIVLINSNLGGLMQFIHEALDAKLKGMVVTGEGGVPRAMERFDAALRWLKVPTGQGALRGRVEAMLAVLPAGADGARVVLEETAVAAALGEGSADRLGAALQAALPAGGGTDAARLCDDVVRHASRLAGRIALAAAARREVVRALDRSADAEANTAFRRAYRSLFLDRIAVLWNTDATGDQVIDFMAHEIPPGQDARIMGCQNIKGTGLDFVYRWLSIDRVRTALQRIRQTPAPTLAFFASYTDFGLIDLREALDALRVLRDGAPPEWAAHRHLLDAVLARLIPLEKEKSAHLAASGKASRFVRMLDGIEQLVDHLDSIRRGRLASRVMADLFEARIGHGRAALLLRGITARQKGGWMAKDLAAWTKRRRRNEATAEVTAKTEVDAGSTERGT